MKLIFFNIAFTDKTHNNLHLRTSMQKIYTRDNNYYKDIAMRSALFAGTEA